MRLQGNHLSGWRHPSNRIDHILDIDYYIEIARKVEAAKFDSLFIADGLSIINHPWKGLSWLFEPLTLLSALAVSTKHSVLSRLLLRPTLTRLALLAPSRV